MRLKNKIRKNIFALILIFVLLIVLLPMVIDSKVELVYDVEYRNDASQHKGGESNFIEWWYFDGIIDEKISFVLTFWVSKEEDNWINLSIYDSSKNKEIVYRRDFSESEIKVSKEKCKVVMNDSMIVENKGLYSVRVIINDLSLEFNLMPTIPGFGIGVKDFLGNIRFWPYIVAVPRGEIKGVLKYSGETMEFVSQGYHDHNYFTSQEFYNFGGWYWGRFFSDNFTIIVAQRFKQKENSMAVIFKNNKLFKSLWGRNKKFLDENIIESINKERVPEIIKFNFNGLSLSLHNNRISQKTKDHLRFINECDFLILNDRDKYTERGRGLSEFSLQASD